MWETESQPHAYRFEPQEIDQIRRSTATLHDIALAVAEHAAQSEEALDLLAIPDSYKDLVVNSWRRGDHALYQRMDLVPGVDGELKLLEYNADTPTGLVEMHCYLVWLQDFVDSGCLPRNADQFNDVRYALIERIGELAVDGVLHVSAARGLPEEVATVRFLAGCAEDADLTTRLAYLDEIGIDADNNLADGENYVIANLFKLFPWEDIASGDFAEPVRQNTTCRFLEPPWKMMWSNKAFLVLAWQLFEGHPNLLPAYFADDPRVSRLARYVRKPQWGREGQNTSIIDSGVEVEGRPGEYGDNLMIVQEYVALRAYDGRYPVLGSWVINNEPAGLLIREDTARITADLSVCAPHYFLA